MFGKGIYFADMVSKSANYCYALNKEGFILLCEVALGEIQEEIQAKSITKPKKGKHSVKGIFMGPGILFCSHKIQIGQFEE